MNGDWQRNCDGKCKCSRCVKATTTLSDDAVESCLEESRFVDHDRSLTLLIGLSSMYRDQLYVDVKLVAGNREFGCHRNVLAVSSPFFAAMFESNMVEKQQEKIPIKEMDPSTLSLVLDYIYTGEVELTVENVQNVLSAANMFQVLALRDGCAVYMMRHVTVSNSVGVYFFAKAHECKKLAARARSLICAEFEAVCCEMEFRTLVAEQLIELISDDQVSVSCEEVIYEACMAWLEHSPSERKADLADVLGCVRFANISPFYFCDNIDNNPLLVECKALDKMLTAVRHYHMMCNRHLEFDLNNVPRNGMQYERGIVILANPYAEDNLKKFHSVEVVLPKTGEVKFLCKLPQCLFMPGVCVAGDNQIFLAGGALRKISHSRHDSNRVSVIPEGVSPNVFTLNIGLRTWDAKIRMNHQRCQFPLVVVDGALYAVGGQDELDTLNQVERYDLKFGTWSSVSPLPQKLRCSTAVSYKGHLYVFGGESPTAIVNTAYKYDPVSNSWTTLQHMQCCRALACSVVYHNKIYVIGGNSASSAKWKKEYLPEHCIASVEIYDPDTNVWSSGPDLANALCGAGIVKYGDSIVLVGGEDDKSWMAGMYRLREDESSGTQSWVAGQELALVMSTFGCVVANIPKDVINSMD